MRVATGIVWLVRAAWPLRGVSWGVPVHASACRACGACGIALRSTKATVRPKGTGRRTRTRLWIEHRPRTGPGTPARPDESGTPESSLEVSCSRAATRPLCVEACPSMSLERCGLSFDACAF
eukprot:4920686-Prymnesium_polylepis.1